MEATHHSPLSGTTSPNHLFWQDGIDPAGQQHHYALPLEAVAPCLADIRRQLDLRSAMA